MDGQQNSLSLLGKPLAPLHVVGGEVLGALEVDAQVGEVGEEAETIKEKVSPPHGEGAEETLNV